MQLETWSDSNIGRVRSTNQDTVGCFPEEALFIVADGMGGRSEGEVASRLATEVVHGHFAAAPTAVTMAPRPTGLARLFTLKRGGGEQADADQREWDRLRVAIEAANRRVFDEGQTRKLASQGTMGTTVVVLHCLLPEKRAHWAYVGDSRLYRARNRRLMLLTADHTLYGEAYREVEEIPSDLPHTNRLVRAVGIHPDVEVSTGADALQAGDLFLMCSDGISGMISAPEIEAEMFSGQSLEEIGNALIGRAMDAGGKDNASALLVKVSGA